MRQRLGERRHRRRRPRCAAGIHSRRGLRRGLYAACAQRGGRFAARLRELERDERAHLRTLQGEYFLLTGEKCLPPGSCPLPRGGLRALRSAYLDELAAAEGYRRAADAPENADLAAIYLRHASDEERHAGILKELILCAL